MAFSLALLVGFLTVSVIYADDKLWVNPSEPILLNRENASLSLACYAKTATAGTSLVWMPSSIGNIERTEKYEEAMYDLAVTLKISKFESSDSGNYTCNHLTKNGTLISSITSILKAVKETKKDYVFVDGKEAANLSCKIDLPNISKVRWLQNDTYVSDLKDTTNYQEQNDTLVILKPERKLAGVYIARFTIDGRIGTYDCEVDFTAAPAVEKFEKSKNLIQDDNMELQCKVLGYPRATVTWFKDTVELNVTGENSRIILLPLNGYKNARLQIKNVEFSDAGEYECRAFSVYFNESSSASVTVRVKDKLAALWPFLGIVGEVVVLCTIIFIYEKRRNKQAEQEEINAQEADDAISDKKDGLRHRNTASNNPTA
ncbi:hypothetical protein Btru_023943 [Bulinus truncatus]|nr:hypothetical protein Btru_023943 [Bulinus truncatus]